MTDQQAPTAEETKQALEVLARAIGFGHEVLTPVGAKFWCANIIRDAPGEDGPYDNLLEYHASSESAKRSIVGWVIQEYSNGYPVSGQRPDGEDWELGDDENAIAEYMRTYTDDEIIDAYFDGDDETECRITECEIERFTPRLPSQE